MINYKQLKTITNPFFEKAWQLYNNAFPENERRNLNGQIHILKLKAYHCESIYIENKHIGILFWWNFETLRYIEHIAIVPELQNKGLGNIIINHFLNQDQSKPTLLEVEPSITNIQKRRISFL
ncbi:GNAT family N-acetyltransferase [Formosa sp. L2A11]|uniref:GNAT family N-acetyltransferase n=1 Tax=Formosa sp. L2A11 TaxID=2686363 RepID=UPI00131C1C21|nr:GNAT family N-acetyltransferase [Formosa sp. L2A11]